MILVALTGGMATGKSHVGKILESLGCHLIEADALGHLALSPGGEAFAPVVAEFGTGILKSNGSSIDRKVLASIVFTDPEKLHALNAIVHPAVARLQQGKVEAIQKRDPNAIIVVEAAIHIETGGYKRYQKLILVICEEQEQVKRAMARDGANREEVLARIAQQMPLSEKRKYADYVIDTSGTPEDTRRQTVEVYNSLRGL